MTMNIVKKLGWQLYLINPYEHMFENMEDLPKANYLNQVFRYSFKKGAKNRKMMINIYDWLKIIIILFYIYSRIQYLAGLCSWKF